MGIAQTVETLNAELVPARRGRLVEIAEDIHAHPEIRWEERYSSALLADELEQEGAPAMATGLGELKDARHGEREGEKSREGADRGSRVEAGAVGEENS